MESSTTPWEDDEWELCNDDGFVYKRRKSLASEPQPDRPVSELASAQENRTDRKRKALVKLRDQYRREIHHWEVLSNTLRAMEDTTTAIHLRRSLSPEDSSPSIRVPATESGCDSVVDGLLWQVEAQEAIIRDASTLCDIAESLCDAQEEEEYQSLIDLPIWALPASPRKLLASLCDQ